MTKSEIINKPIKLLQLMSIEDPKQYKAHCAVWNAHNHPLDAFVRGEWIEWQRYRYSKNQFNRKYIFSMMDFYHEREAWLFGGIYRVTERFDDRYEVELVEQGAEYIGRLKFKFKLIGRNSYRKLEYIYDNMEVVQILREPYVGTTFRGYENINLTFEQIETIMRNQTPDWYGALRNAKGIYLIMDMKTGKGYVGSAYGDNGIWDRWSQYVMGSGHGGNKELVELLNKLEPKDAKAYMYNFKYTLLEYCPKNMDDNAIIEREGYWKSVLLTRNFGYNAN